MRHDIVNFTGWTVFPPDSLGHLFLVALLEEPEPAWDRNRLHVEISSDRSGRTFYRNPGSRRYKRVTK